MPYICLINDIIFNCICHHLRWQTARQVCDIDEMSQNAAPIFFLGGGADTQKSLLGFHLPADTRHVLKFRTDPSTGVDEIGCKKH